MPYNKTHCRDQNALLGKGPWKELNDWMDAPRKSLGTRHRKVRHADSDPASMLMAAVMFGPQAPEAMIIHTVRDRMQTQIKKAIGKSIGLNLFE